MTCNQGYALEKVNHSTYSVDRSYMNGTQLIVCLHDSKKRFCLSIDDKGRIAVLGRGPFEQQLFYDIYSKEENVA